MSQKPLNPLTENQWPEISKEDAQPRGKPVAHVFSLSNGVLALGLMVLMMLGLLLLSNRATQERSDPAGTTATPPPVKLPFDVVDAQYSPALNRIILISQQPQQLHIYDPETHEDVTIALSRPPTSLSVDPSGRFAAVGHDARVSYIDLQQHQLVQELVTEAPVIKVALSNHGWVYVATQIGDTGDLIAYSLARKFDDDALWDGIATALKIHPEGYNLFAIAKDGYEIAQYNNTRGVLVPMRDWLEAPETRQRCPNFWFSQDGAYLYNACGDIFTAIPLLTPFTYKLTGSLTGQQPTGMKQLIYQLVHVADADRIILIAGEYAASAPGIRRQSVILPTNRLLLYEASSLDLIGKINLPSIDSRATTPSVGRFIFTDTSGTAYYLILQQGNEFGLIIATLTPTL